MLKNETKTIPTLFRQSFAELKKTRTITLCAMLMALSVVLGYFSLNIGPYLRIGLSSVVNAFISALFGPGVGGIFGAAGDIIKYFLKPAGPFFPGFTFNALLSGVIYGFLLYRKPLRFRNILLAKLAVILVVNLCLGTLWLDMMYGKSFFVILPMRALKNFLEWPVDSILLYLMLKSYDMIKRNLGRET